MGRFVLLAVALIVFLTTTCQTYVHCGKGEYLHLENLADHQFRLGRCETCPKDEYMDEDHHNHISCKKCLVLNDHNNCYDFVEDYYKIDCAPGFYYDQYSPDGFCRSCANCTINIIEQFVAKYLTKNKNAVCCPHDGMFWIHGICISIILVLFVVVCLLNRRLKNLRSIINQGVTRWFWRALNWLLGVKPGSRAGGIEFELCPNSDEGPAFTSV